MDTTASFLNPHKLLKEQFVSNLSGSSMTEILILNVAMPVLILLRHCMYSYEVDTKKNLSKKNDEANLGLKSLRACVGSMTMDFLMIILPVVLFLTVLSEWIYLATASLTLLLVIIIAAMRTVIVRLLHGIYLMAIVAFNFRYLVLRPFSSRSKGSPTLENDTNSVWKSISSYRVTVMIVTCLCILAVDFQIYPRRHAKTETYGTGLMDLGVGSFVLSNALLSQQARGFSASRLKSTLQSSSPLLVLGVARLITTASVDYQVHVGEYGVHWNFFFTLAAVALVTTIINVPTRYSGTFGFFILVGYQVCLLRGLNVYLLSNQRGIDIISQNKEGIFSIFGYWALYLVGVQLGNYLFFGNSRQVSRLMKWARIRLWLLTIFFGLLTVLLDRYVERVSRRMCNAAYVTFIVAQNLLILSMFSLSDFIPGHKITWLEESFNQNLLASFILANLLTGLVNLSINTLFASSALALSILVVYTFLLSFVMGLAHFYNIKLKFW